jgi:hypothetical protein
MPTASNKRNTQEYAGNSGIYNGNFKSTVLNNKIYYSK